MYVIWTPDYRNNSNGIKVLHKLCHLLNEKGEKAEIYIPSQFPQTVNPQWNTPIYKKNYAGIDDIVIYPDITVGNPLGAVKKVRYLLNKPGVMGGPTVFDNELIFTFHKEYYDAPILYIPTIEPELFNNDTPVERKRNCFYIGKGKDVPKINTEGMTEITSEWPSTRKELADLLRKSETFYTYDFNTALILEAKLCGCRVEIIPKIETYLSVEIYNKAVLESPKQLDNFIKLTKEYNPKFVSVIIPTYNSQEVFEMCYRSLAKAGYPIHVTVIDNKSKETKYLNQQMDVIYNDQNYKFTHAVNQGLKIKAPYTLLLNPDCLGNLQDNWLKKMVDELEKENAGIAGAILKFPDGKIQHAGAYGFGNHIGLKEEDKGQYDKIRECEWVTGACMLIKREVVEKIGEWDEVRHSHYERDRDWCKKAKENGIKIICSTAKLTHLEGGSSVEPIKKHDGKLRILWHSNSTWTPTGYGNQTALITRALYKAGYPIAVSSYYGLEGGMLNLDGIPHYPKMAMTWGEDSMVNHAKDFQADVVISLCDIWILQTSMFKDIKWIPWSPVDHDEVPNPVEVRAKEAYKVLSYSKSGYEAFKRKGIENTYIPHCIDTKIFKPYDKIESRKIYAIPEDAYVVGMVAQNKSMPSRKSFQQAFEAFKIFSKDKPKARLYLHTVMDTIQGGMNIAEYAQHLGILDRITFTLPYNYLYKFGSEDMAKLYSSFDVLLNPSMGEGFGIPIVEAQACGVPVIVGNWTSMPELCGAGEKVEFSEKWWTTLAAYQYYPKVESIVSALEKIYKGDKTEYSKKAVDFTKQYDVDKVIRDYWIPFLQSL